MKQINGNWKTLIVIAVFLIVLGFIKIDVESKIVDFFLTFIAGLFFKQLYDCLSYKKEQTMDACCKYQKDLYELGILNIYPNRRGKQSNYISDLLNDFENLDKKHSLVENPVPIKIIGVALEVYFGIPVDLPLSQKIKECCKKAYFNVLLCREENPELINRYNKKNVTAESDIFYNIEQSVDRIRKIANENEDRLKYHQYMFSPYATIIFINDHIYYTPHILDPKFYDDNAAELTLRLDRRLSIYGKKLERQFDTQWNDEEKVR